MNDLLKKVDIDLDVDNNQAIVKYNGKRSFELKEQEIMDVKNISLKAASTNYPINSSVSYYDLNDSNYYSEDELNKNSIFALDSVSGLDNALELVARMSVACNNYIRPIKLYVENTWLNEEELKRRNGVYDALKQEKKWREIEQIINNRIQESNFNKRI